MENAVIPAFSRPTSSGMSYRAVRGLTPNHFPRQFSIELFLLLEYLCGLWQWQAKDESTPGAEFVYDGEFVWVQIKDREIASILA